MGRLYARVASNTGWTPREIDAMPLRRVLDLLRYWGEVPPLQEVMALQAGFYKPRQAQEDVATGPQVPMTDEEVQRMLAELNGE